MSTHRRLARPTDRLTPPTGRPTDRSTNSHDPHRFNRRTMAACLQVTHLQRVFREATGSLPNHLTSEFPNDLPSKTLSQALSQALNQSLSQLLSALPQPLPQRFL